MNQSLIGTAFLILAACAPVASQPTRSDEGAAEWGIVVHGGAGAVERGRLTPAGEAQYRAKLEEALRAGHAILARGGTSLDAVVAAVQILEDSPLFNAGKGAVRNSQGRVELDASLMEGRTRRAGAVAGVMQVKNPIGLARLVMERSQHVMLAGTGAEAFATQHGVELVPQEYFLAEGRAGSTALGTVGAVALDRSGNLAAGTSTGGMAGKLPGRVGDSPIIGAGTYADNRCGAISGTGHGEFFIRAVVAYDICAITLYEGIPIRDAADGVIMESLVRLGGEGGVIALAPDGTVAMPFNTAGMFRGLMMSDGRPSIAVYRD